MKKNNEDFTKSDEKKEKELAKILRNELRRKDIPFIFVTPSYSNFNGSIKELMCLIACFIDSLKECKVPYSIIQAAVEAGYEEAMSDNEVENVMEQLAEMIKDLRERNE